MRIHTLGRATAAGVPVRDVRIHQAGASSFVSVQTESAEKMFVFDARTLKSVARILCAIENASKHEWRPRMLRLFFCDDGSLILDE